MSVVEYHAGHANGSRARSGEGSGARVSGTPMRYRGWALLALGLGSWAGLFKIFGWF